MWSVQDTQLLLAVAGPLAICVMLAVIFWRLDRIQARREPPYPLIIGSYWTIGGQVVRVVAVFAAQSIHEPSRRFCVMHGPTLMLHVRMQSGMPAQVAIATTGEPLSCQHLDVEVFRAHAAPAAPPTPAPSDTWSVSNG